MINNYDDRDSRVALKHYISEVSYNAHNIENNTEKFCDKFPINFISHCTRTSLYLLYHLYL